MGLCSTFTWSVVAVFVAWFVGLLLHLSPELQKYTNWVGEFQCDAKVERPTDVEQLQSLVKGAPSVRVTGSGCSFNTMACPKSYGVVVDMGQFQKMELLDGGTLVKVQAGAFFGQLLDFLLESGLTISYHPGNPTYTVGGCIATGCHNMGMLHVGDATEITFLTADGSFHSVSHVDADWPAAAVSMGRLGIIFDVTLRTSFYAPHVITTTSMPLAGPKDIIDVLEKHRDIQAANASRRLRLEFRIELGDLQEQFIEFSPKTERSKIPLADGFKHFKNPSYFRLQPQTMLGGSVKLALEGFQRGFALVEELLRGISDKMALHTGSQILLSGMPEKMKRRHQGRAGNTDKIWGNRHTWGNVVDEAFNFLFGLRHSEVVFPVEPREKAIKCMDVFFKYKHFYWFRSYIRMMPGDPYYLSTVHLPADLRTNTNWFVRVDFVTPGKILEREELAFTRELHEKCPGWRKHWGKSLWSASAEETWGEPDAFKEVMSRWDPACKFRPVDWPSWVDVCPLR